MTSHSDDDAKTVGITLMQGIATGSLLYVVFFEVIEKERAGSTSHSLQLVFIILGSVTIVSLKVSTQVKCSNVFTSRYFTNMLSPSFSSLEFTN